MASFEREADRLSIHEFFSRYAHAVDCRDWALYRSLFTEDAFLDYHTGLLVLGMNLLTLHKGDLESTVAWLSKSLDSHFAKGGTMHLISNVYIEFDPRDASRAKVEAMFHNPMVLWFLPKTELFTVGGWYVHDMVKGADGKWRSKHIVERIAYNSLYWEAFKLLVLLWLAYKALRV